MQEKSAVYALLLDQVRALAEGEDDLICLMANVSAALYDTLPDLNWAGFYRVKDGVLVLGPFQGKVACTRIARGKGVCGTAWAENRSQLVPDVHAFHGHIACDAASRSEVVVPLRDAGGAVRAVLDLDSPSPARFEEADLHGLEAVAEAVAALV